MKSKAEIVEALKCHMSGDCSECSYREGWHTCNPTPERGLFADILAFLNKSDFEVMKEILERSEEYHNDYSYEIQGNDYPTIILHRDTQMLWVDFDNKGDIL